MRRIQIIGYSGSGKTTLARSLSEKLNIPHYELDSLFHMENWGQKPDDEFRREVAAIIKKKQWILCGNYINRLEGRSVMAADTVIVLRYHWSVSILRMIKRTIKRVVTREQLWGKNREKFVDFFFLPSRSLLHFNIRQYAKEGRDHNIRKLDRYGQLDKAIVLNSPKETAIWLANLK